MTDWLRLFQEIADEIRREAQPLFGSEKAAEAMGRGAGGDVSKYVDTLAENIVVKTLEAEKIPCMLITEESGKLKISGGGESYVVLDSIDGTTNATRDIPFVSTCLAHATGSRLSDVDVGLVKDLYQNVNFTAIKGKGAHRAGKLLSPSTVSSLGRAIIAINLAPKEKLPELIERISPILCRSLKIRHLGSTALEVCYVASGALDVFLDPGGLTRATDLAAAYLVLKEAGGISVTSSGEKLDMSLRASARAAFISGANQALCNEILDCLKTRRG